MSAEQVIFINLLLYLGGFAFFLWQQNTLSEQSLGWLSVAVNFIGTLFSMGIRLSDVTEGTSQFQWFTIGKHIFTFDLIFNDLTFLLYFIVQFVGLLVQIFSMEYMKGDFYFGRYFAFLNLFIFSMLGVVVSGNLLVVYFFWELVGFSSYLLIGFWYERPAAIAASKKAFLVNRIGDIGFLLGIFMVFRQIGTFGFQDISHIDPSSNAFWLTTTGLLLFCGCIAKSAQFPLQIWLPDAMEGPTPVSALIHAATMVAAGIFLMARISPMLTDDALFIIAIIGTITMFMGAYSAMVQYDMKKVLAYSTISQLGLMVMGIGVKAVNASLFHLTTHAFFKAGLFLCVGAVINQVHEQDMRKIGGLRREMPLVFYCYAICAAALAGLPFFSGFLSKDALLIAAFQWANEKENLAYFVIPGVAVVVSGMTAFYMMRQLYMIFIGQEHLNPLKIASTRVVSFSKSIARTLESIVKVEDDDENEVASTPTFDFQNITNIDVVLMILAFTSIGFIFSGNPFKVEESWFFQSFPIELKGFAWLPSAAIGVSILGLVLGYIFTEIEVQRAENKPLNFFAKLSYNHFYINSFYEKIFSNPIVWLSQKLHYFDIHVIDKFINLIAQLQVILADMVSWFDENVIDSSVNFVGWASQKTGSFTRQIQNGKAQSYLVALFMGVILVVALMMI
jgi:NADH-quinone oxidoreductase subunit L